MIDVRDITFSYSSKQPLFNNLSLKLEGGHIYGFLGKNGAGKTSLLKNMVGLRFISSGQCEAFGTDVRKRDPEVLSRIYLLPEEVWLPDVSIESYRKVYAGSWPTFNNDYFQHCLRSFDINPTAKLKKMSFGQRKKAAISFALATNVNVLLLDEPTNGLDIPSKGIFRKLAAELVDENRCIVLSTHQVRDLETLIDTVIVLDEGRIVLNKSIEEICEKLYFSTIASFDKPEGALYSELTPKGFTVITPNTEREESKVDLEALFNLCTQHPETIINLFNA
jgi:ABC-2 type transport system ATP-binding protein